MASEFKLRPYQEQAVKNIFSEWYDKKRLKTLLVLATGLGKTIVFCNVISKCVDRGQRVLILAHRGELLDQASDKLKKTTGLETALEKAKFSCLDMPNKVVVGSVQTLQSEKRLARFSPDYFDVIVVDEAHHCLSDGYQRVLQHFPLAHVLGVTATPDRGDKRNLGQYFESIAFEYSIAEGIREGYLSKIRAQTIPLNIDISGVSQSNGDFSAGELGEALAPYLEAIADKMCDYCPDRKTIVFLPLVATSRKFKDILIKKGFRAEEISGNDFPELRKQKLKDFENGKTNVLCNSMLLTEGFDCPSIDCVICLRPTKVRSLYTQIVGRGTRLSPGKEYLLLLDFLWHTERHDLCHPCHLVTDNPKVQQKMTEIMEESADDELTLFDLEELEVKANDDVIQQREQALAEQLKAMKTRESKFVDPLQWEMSINTNDLANYEETFAWEKAPITEKQIAALEKFKINPDKIETAGKAALILDKLNKRAAAGLSTPKQIRFLEKRGFKKVGEWRFDEARSMIDRIAGNGWRTPSDVVPSIYKPTSLRPVQQYQGPNRWANLVW